MNIYHTCKNSQQRPGRREDCTNCNPGKRADKSNEIIVRQAAQVTELRIALSLMFAEFEGAAETHNQMEALRLARQILARGGAS